jgi:hypothetical protein
MTWILSEKGRPEEEEPDTIMHKVQNGKKV